MNYYLKPRLIEIKEQLGPVLKGLRLKTRAALKEDSIEIEFVSQRDNKFSPVKIVFADKKSTGLDEASWKEAHLEVEVWGARTLGETGWESWKHFDTIRREITGNGSDMFARLGTIIEYHGLVPRLLDSPNCISNSVFGDAYKIVSRWASDVTITQFCSEHNFPWEELQFRDGEGHPVRILMSVSSGYAIMYYRMTRVDFNQHDLVQLNDRVRELCNGLPYEPPKALVR